MSQNEQSPLPKQPPDDVERTEMTHAEHLQLISDVDDELVEAQTRIAKARARLVAADAKYRARQGLPPLKQAHT